VSKGVELLRGHEEEVLKLLPLDVSDYRPVLWPPNKVRKIVLMSATIGEVDIRDLGLNHRRVSYIQADSIIPVDRRPIIYDPVGSVAYNNQAVAIPRIADRIREQLRNNSDKGMIHATYGMIGALRELLDDEPRLIFHTRDNKKEMYDRFIDSTDGVLVASGLYEGVSLDYELGRWQFITKVPYPSLAEPAIKYRCELEPEWYQWQAVKLILQASGRICRGPDDYGATYILDNCFERLYSGSISLFPKWYQDSLIFTDRS
jgi:Rad3-related DNA helicase